MLSVRRCHRVDLSHLDLKCNVMESTVKYLPRCQRGWNGRLVDVQLQPRALQAVDLSHQRRCAWSMLLPKGKGGEKRKREKKGRCNINTRCYILAFGLNHW